MNTCKYGYIHHRVFSSNHRIVSYDQVTLCVYCERDALKALVRELAQFAEYVAGHPLPTSGGDYLWRLSRTANEFLSRPEVRAIMEEE
jgi:hypothetical protein